MTQTVKGNRVQTLLLNSLSHKHSTSDNSEASPRYSECAEGTLRDHFQRKHKHIKREMLVASVAVKKRLGGLSQPFAQPFA